jgi:hypothetical protein
MPTKGTRNAAAIVLVVAAGGQPALAEGFTCFVIQPGDTASLLAWRLTGDMEHRHEPWFQIVEPATSRYVPKSEYRRIYPGWHACVAEERLQPQWVQAAEAPPPIDPPPPMPPADAGSPLATPGVAAIGSAVLLSLAALLAWHIAAAYSSGRQKLVTMMTLYGERFVREFERPLLRPGSERRALKARLRIKPIRQRLDILLAPNEGRTYPNLADHRKNVEYDVGRVLRMLNDKRFVSERLSRQGRWVIVRCRFRADLTSGGGP